MSEIFLESPLLYDYMNIDIKNGHPHRTEEVWIKAEPIDTEFTSDSIIANHKEFVKNEPESPAEVEFPGTVNIKSEISSDGYECISLSDSVASQPTNDEIQPTTVKTEKLNCDECEKTFASKRNFQIHKRCHQGGKSFPCDECSRAFTQATTLARHKLTHSAKPSSKTKFQTKELHTEGGSPKDATQPNDQQTQTNGRRLFPCDECEKSFTRKDALNRHNRTHKSASTNETNCQDEQRIRTDHVGRYSCGDCGKSFTLKNTLTRHMNTHGEKSFSCDICGMRFTLKRYVVTHMRNHLPARPYSCDKCGKTYRQRSNLNRHKMSHSGLRPFACIDCEKTFAQKLALKRHKRDFHRDANAAKRRKVSCEECGAKFKSKRKLRAHQQTHDTIREEAFPFACDLCDEKFPTIQDLNFHGKKHTNLGSVCGIKLESKINEKCDTSEQPPPTPSPATIASNSAGDFPDIAGIKSEITFGDYEFVIHVMPT